MMSRVRWLQIAILVGSFSVKGAAIPLAWADHQKPSRTKPLQEERGKKHRNQKVLSMALIQRRCEKYEAELERIQDRLRGGYRENRGNRLRQRRRELSDKLYHECRG